LGETPEDGVPATVEKPCFRRERGARPENTLSTENLRRLQGEEKGEGANPGRLRGHATDEARLV
jgi:hypothetical protein